MNVAYILPYLRQPSGWRTLSLGVVNAMQDYIRPIVFVEPEDLATARQYFPNVELFSLPATQQYSFSSRRGWRNLFRSYRVIQQISYPHIDLVHSLEAYPCGLVGHWLSQKYNCPHVMTANGTYAIIWIKYLLDRLMYQRVLAASKLVCPISNSTAGLMKRYFGSSLKNTAVVSILIGNDFYQRVPQSQALERIPPAQPTILTVGDVKPRKGQMITIKAFKKVKKSFPEARYWIVGDYKPNDYFHGIQKIIADDQIEDVFFWGRVADEKLCECYQKASLFVLAPQPLEGAEKMHVEGFGLVYLEAGAYGLPVIGTRSGGVPDAIREGETGLLVEPGDTDGLAEAMGRLLADPILWKKMGNANRRWSERLTWGRYAGEQYQAYRQVLASP